MSLNQIPKGIKAEAELTQTHRENQLSWQVEMGGAALMPTPAWRQTPLSHKNKDSSSDNDSVTWAHLMVFHEMEMFRLK